MKIFILNLAIFSIFNSQAVIHFWNSVINFTKITVVAIFYMVSALTVWSSIEQINFFKKVKQRYLTLVEPELLEIEVIIGKIPKNKPHFGVWKINTFFFSLFSVYKVSSYQEANGVLRAQAWDIWIRGGSKQLLKRATWEVHMLILVHH